MNLSQNFSLAELIVTQSGLPNAPGQVELANLQKLAQTLEAVRSALGNNPITINSAYRSPRVNSAVGGSATSAHMLGLAADFVCPTYGKPIAVCQAIAASGIQFDQLIHEYGRWIHIGIGPRARQQLLTIDSRGIRTGLFEVRQ